MPRESLTASATTLRAVSLKVWRGIATTFWAATFAGTVFAQENPASTAPASAENAVSEKPAASATGDIIYPRHAAPADSPAAPTKSGTGNGTILLLALGAAAAGGWLLWRQRHAVNAGGGAHPRKLSVAESRSLGNRQYLVVADYDGRKFLLGVCPGRIDMLTPLDGATVPANRRKDDEA